MREIIAANGFCGVTELFENSTSVFSSGQFLLPPTKKAAKDPTLNKLSSSES